MTTCSDACTQSIVTKIVNSRCRTRCKSKLVFALFNVFPCKCVITCGDPFKANLHPTRSLSKHSLPTEKAIFTTVAGNVLPLKT